MADDIAFIAAALDFSNAGPDHFKPGYEEYRDLALAASRVATTPPEPVIKGGGDLREALVPFADLLGYEDPVTAEDVVIVKSGPTTDYSISGADILRARQALTPVAASLPVAVDLGERARELLAHVAGGGPHEWGYRCLVSGQFLTDDWPFRAAEFLAALNPARAGGGEA